MEHDSCKAGGESSEAQQKMVKFELEAAEALAGLAHSAMPQEETERRPSQRLKHGTSSPHDSVITLPSACDPHLLQVKLGFFSWSWIVHRLGCFGFGDACTISSVP